MKRYLIIFAKEPEKDKVKTRLSECLSKEQCVKLYKAFLRDTIDMVNDVQCEEKMLAYVSATTNPSYLKKIAPGFIFYKQKGRNLGQRMYNAFKFAQMHKASKMVIIGSDSPSLPVSFIEEAFRKLDKYHVVIGPSYDGGYYLIGLKNSCSGLFKGIKWSSDKVFKDTVKKSRNLKKRIARLDKWYDVDTPEALMYLENDLRKKKDRDMAKWTKRFLKV